MLTRPRPRRSATRGRLPRAFTLLELVVVLVVLALLAALAVPTFLRVTKTSRLEVAEVTASAVIRDSQALGAVSSHGGITRDDVTTAVGELPGRVASGAGTLADATTATVVFGTWEFSGASSTISASLTPDPTGQSLGVAIWVPGAGCAYAHSTSATSGTTSWHVLDTDADVTSCGAGHILCDPDSCSTPLPVPPRRPHIRLGPGTCTTDASLIGRTVLLDDDPTTFPGPFDVFVDGKYVGTYTLPSCVPMDPNSGPGDVVVIPSTNPVGPNPAPMPRDGSGTVVTGPATYLLSWSDGSGGAATVTFTPSAGSTGSTAPVTVGTGASGAMYYTVPAGVSGVFTGALTSGGSASVVPSRTSAPPAPTGGDNGSMAVDLLDGYVHVYWGAVPDTKLSPLTGYRLYRGTGATQAAATAQVTARALTETLQTPAKTDTSAVDGPLSATGWYCYALSAYGPGGDSGQSNVACVQIGNGATNLRAAPGDGTAAVSWDPVSGATSYRVNLYARATSTLLRTVTVASTSTATTLTGLTDGTAYVVTLTATTPSGPTQPVSASVTPRAAGSFVPGLLSELATTNGTWANPVTSGAVTVTVDSTRSGNLVASATDRSLTTSWTNNGGGTSTYTVDLGAYRRARVDSMYLNASNLIKNSYVRASLDGSNWTTLWTQGALSPAVDTAYEYSFTTGSSTPWRYVQVVRPSTGNTYKFGISEIELYGSLSTVPLTTTASSHWVTLGPDDDASVSTSIKRSTSPDMSNAVVVGTGTTSVTDTGVSPGQTYYYQAVPTTASSGNTSAVTAVTTPASAPYDDAVMASSPLAYLPLAETSGTVAANVGSNATAGTYSGTPVFGGAGPLTSQPSRSVTGSLLVPRSVSGDLTIEVWVSSTGGNYAGSQWYQGAAVASCDVAGTANDLGITIGNYGRAIFGTGNPDTSIDGPVVNDGSWHLLTATRVKSTGAMALYVDGKPAGTATGGKNNLTDCAHLAVGGSGVADVALYGTALDATTVLAHYNAAR